MAVATDDGTREQVGVAVALHRECVVLSGTADQDHYTGHRALSEILPLIGLLHHISQLDSAFGHASSFGRPKDYVEKLSLSDLTNNDAIQSRLFDMLREDGLEITETGFLISTAFGTIRIEGTFLESVEGSHFSKIFFKILPNEETTKGILWGALLSALLNLATPDKIDTISISTVPPTDVVMQPATEAENISDTLYVCTFGGTVNQDHDAVVAEALRILSDEMDNTESIQARQACLKALGLYDGEIDGVAGPLTRAAESSLVTKFNILHVNWHDQNFCRFVFQRAAQHVNASVSD